MSKNKVSLIVSMKKFDYSSLSTQHLLMFITLHEQRTITATAETLEMTQSAVSHCLQKLRIIFGDELFIRSGRGVLPTAHSVFLYTQLKPMLEQLQALTEKPEFEPATAQLDYRVLANDYQIGVFLPALYSRLQAQLASCRLTIEPSRKPDAKLLRQPDVDVVFSPFAPEASDIMATRLFDDVAVCFYDPQVRSAPQTSQDFLTARYVGLNFTKGVSVSRSDNAVIEAIDANTVVRVESFGAVAMFVQGSDRLAVVPNNLHATSFASLACVPLPYATSPFAMYMLWHKKNQHDAKHRWFREQVKAVTSGLVV